MINWVKAKVSKISFYEEKKRLVLFSLLLLLCLFFAYYLFQFAYSSYQSSAKLNANIDMAVYFLSAEKMSFNIDPEQIIPSNDPYVYKFSVSNFDGSKSSDIDLEYTIQIITTTNLPLTFQLFRNENYDDAGASNLLSGSTVGQDEDGAWYTSYQPSEKYPLLYEKHTTDIYTLVVYFPIEYSQNLEYADNIESIEIIIDSQQMID